MSGRPGEPGRRHDGRVCPRAVLDGVDHRHAPVDDADGRLGNLAGPVGVCYLHVPYIGITVPHNGTTLGNPPPVEPGGRASWPRRWPRRCGNATWCIAPRVSPTCSTSTCTSCTR